MAESAQAVRVDLKRSASSGRDALRAVRQLLTDVGAFALLQDASLAVTELTTSAVVRASQGCRLVALWDAARERLCVELIGCDFASPPLGLTVSRPDPSLFPIVAALSTEWGIDPTDDGAVVWFEMLQCAVSDVPV